MSKEYVYPFNLFKDNGFSLGVLVKDLRKSRSHVHRLATGLDPIGKKIEAEIRLWAQNNSVPLDEDWQPNAHKGSHARYLTWQEYCDMVDSLKDWTEETDKRISELEETVKWLKEKK